MYNVSPSPHIAALAAESDTIKLVRELEALRKERTELVQRIDESDNTVVASRVEHQATCDHHRGVVTNAQQRTRVIDAQIANVMELLQPLVGGQNRDQDCAVQTLRR